MAMPTLALLVAGIDLEQIVVGAMASSYSFLLRYAAAICRLMTPATATSARSAL